MKKIDIVVPVQSVEYSELTTEQQRVVDEARAATLRSYAPYSKFRVGAAILLSDGVVVTGSNQENVAYPSGTCAERTACYYAGANHPGARFERIAISARGTDGEEVSMPIPPCGACRQALLEYEKLAQHDVEVILVGRDCIYILPSVGSLLPLAFSEF